MSNRRPLINSSINLTNNQKEVGEQEAAVPVTKNDNLNEPVKDKVKKPSIEGLKLPGIQEAMEKKNKLTMRETHKHETFLIERDVLDKFNQIIKIVKKSDKGAKTTVINSIIKDYVEEAGRQGFEFK